MLFARMNRLIICILSSLSWWNTSTYLGSSDRTIAVWLLLALPVRIKPCLTCFLPRRNVLVLTVTIINTISIIHACWKNTSIDVCIILSYHLPLWIWRNLIFGCNSTCRFSSTRLRNILRCQFSKSLCRWRIGLLLIWRSIRLFSPL